MSLELRFHVLAVDGLRRQLGLLFKFLKSRVFLKVFDVVS